MIGISSSLLSKCARRARAHALPLSLVLFLLFSALAPASRAQLQDSWGQPDSGQKHAPAEFIPGEVIVRFRSEEAADWSESEPGAELPIGRRKVPMRTERFDGSEIVRGLRLVRVPADDTLGAIEALKRRPDVLYAEPNYVRRRLAAANDPRFQEMWGLKNTGQPASSNGIPGVAGADIDAEPAWGLTTGSRNVVVGVIDEGVDVTHPDLAANVWKNPGEVAGNGLDDDANGFVDDVNGWDFFHNDRTVFDGSGAYPSDDTDAHGTHVAGTIGAVGNNGLGVTGVNWQVSLMSLKILGRDGEGMAPSSVLVTVRAYNYAKMMKDKWAATGGAKGANIRVLNNSYGGGGRSQAELDAINALNASGILFVVAAGNAASNNDTVPVYPSNYNAPNVISVAATNSMDYRPYFSNFGPRTVSMAAPGDWILSTTPNGTYSFFSGTSMASPHVAGAAALVCAANPAITVKRLRNALMYSGDVLGTPGSANYSLETISGRRLNALKALQNAAERDTTAPAAVGGLQARAGTGRQFTLTWKAPGDDASTGRAAVYEVRFSDTQPTTAAQFDQARPLLAPFPDPAGSSEQVVVEIPYRHPKGFVSVRAVDNVGNAGPISSVPVSVAQEASDPYVVTLAAPQPLSTGGTRLYVKGDDTNTGDYTLPWVVSYFGELVYSVRASSNGVIYINHSYHATDGTPSLGDAGGTVAGLNSYQMIAGLWDDLRTDRRATDDIYVVKPDANRVIFRWQAVTYNTPITATTSRGENPVSFEIELHRNGTVTLRYGATGNQKLWPVVGLSNGAPDPYDIPSHTSETSLKSLAGAQTVVFTPYSVLHPPPVTISALTISPAAVVDGRTATGKITLSEPAPESGAVITLSDDLTAATMPATVFIPWMNSEATFTIKATSPGGTPQVGTVTAKSGNSTAAAALTVKPISPSTLSFSSNPVSGGASVTGTVGLNAPAPAGGAVVTLSDNLASTTVPASVTVPAGVARATFTVTTKVVTAKQVGTVTASYNGTKSSTLTVRPVGVLSLAVSPSPVTGGSAATGTVTLERASTASTTVTLTDTLASASTPVSVVVPAGATKATFNVTTTSVSKFESGTVTAAASGTSKSAPLTVNPAAVTACAEPSFKVLSKATTTRYLNSAAVGDFNRDGRLDVAAASGYPSSALLTFAGDGVGGLGAPVEYAVAATANGTDFSQGVAVGDFNRDGKPDLVTTVTTNKTVAVLLGDGAGRFGARVAFTTAYKPHSVVVGDFNNDLKPDVAVTSTNTASAAGTDGYVELLLGNGAGGFAAATAFRVGAEPRGLVTGDFNRDGKLDVAAANKSRSVSVLLGNGAGGFTTKAFTFNAGDVPEDLAVGDFNRDGKQDLAVAVSVHFDETSEPYGVLIVMQGNGLGGFTLSPRIFTATNGLLQIVAGDLNGDGKDDVFTTASYESLYGMLGDGAGGFSEPKYYSALNSSEVRLLKTGDFNGDGRLDLAGKEVMVNVCQ
jgi:subtilisin family serine protease